MLPYCQLDPKEIFQWNFIQNSKAFIQQNALENVIWKMAATLTRPVKREGFEKVAGCVHVEELM